MRTLTIPDSGEATDRAWAVQYIRLIGKWANSLGDCLEIGEDIVNPGWWEQEQGNIERNCAWLATLAHARIHGAPSSVTQEARTVGGWYAGVGKRLARLLGRSEAC